jgi:hypothetical protein
MNPRNQSSGERAYLDALIRVSSTIIQRGMLGQAAGFLPHKKFKADYTTIKECFIHMELSRRCYVKAFRVAR